MDPLSIAAGAAGLLSTGITICNGLLGYYNSWKYAEDDVRRMYNSIEALTKTLILIQLSIRRTSFNPDIVVRVEESITSIQGGIESLKKKLDKIKIIPQQEGRREKTKARFQKTLFPFKESTLVKLKELGNELRDDLSIALDALQIDASAASQGKLDLLSQQMTAVSNGVESLKDHTLSVAANVECVQNTSNKTSSNVGVLVSAQNDNYVFKVYNWLSPLASTFEKKQSHTFNLKGRQDGTGKWLLATEEFNDWLQGEGKTLWCPGIPGAGKTVLTSFIINHFQKSLSSDVGIAYIYCIYKEVKEQTLENLVASLVHQLLTKNRSLPAELEALYSAHTVQKTRPSISEYTELLQLVVQSYRKVFIIIDALDECVEVGGTRKELINELQKLQPKVNLLVTSRDIPNVRRQLRGAARLEIQASDEDIRKYIEDRISSSDRLSGYVEKDPNVRNSMIGTIIQNAKGMFLQVRLHLDSLSTKTTLRKFKSALDTLPEGLEETYDEVWQRIKAQNPDDAELATRVIYWIFYVSRPLTVPEIQHALAVELGDTFLDDDNITNEELLVSVCAGIVLVQQEGGTVGLVHYTTQEYFERRAAQHFPSARKEILCSCLTYLLFDDFSSGPCRSNEELDARLQKYPFLRYAGRFWGHHARGGLEESQEELMWKFLNQHPNLFSSIQMIYTRAQNYENYTQDIPCKVIALSIASFFGLYHIVRVLLNEGPDVTVNHGFGMKPLDLAASCGHDEVVRLLLEYKADQFKDSALRQAACNGHEAVVGVLLQYDTDIDAIDNNGMTALQIASDMGHEGLVHLLLSQNADMNLVTLYGRSALYRAARRGNAAVVEVLLNHGASAEVDALHIASTLGHDHVVQRLLENWIDTEMRDLQGRSLLHHACAKGSLVLVERLLSRGSDPRALDGQNRTCLHHAASAGSAKVLIRLLEEGLDSTQVDIDRWTPLHWAARNGTESCVKILLDASGKLMTQSASTWDPRGLAIFHGHFETAKLLSAVCQASPESQNAFNFEEDHLSSLLSQLASSAYRKDVVKAIKDIDVLCDGCDHVIYGPRYKCTICDNFDFCFKCILSSHKTHAFHEFETFLLPRRRQSTFSEVDIDEKKFQMKIKEVAESLAYSVSLASKD